MSWSRRPSWTSLTPLCTPRRPASEGEDFYRDFVDKAAVLLVRLAKNHPLLDGNKRAAWVTLRLFIEINDWSWSAYPSVDDAESAVLGVAAGDWDEERVATCLRERLLPPAREGK